jgi:hypothetical protein
VKVKREGVRFERGVKEGCKRFRVKKEGEGFRVKREEEGGGGGFRV